MEKPIMNKYKFFILILISLVHLKGFSQKGLFSRQKVVNQYATVGIGGGSAHYFGDLAPYRQFYHSFYTNVRWNAGINYTRFLTSNVAARVSFNYARLLGDDYSFSQRNLEKMDDLFLRNLHFRNDIQEFTLTGLFNILPQYGKGPKGRSNIMPYVGVGIGLFGHNPKARPQAEFNSATGTLERQNWTALKQYRTTGQGLPGSTAKSYSLVQPVMPISIGLRVKINNHFDFTAEAGLRLTPFDYLDDVGGGTYPAKGLLAGTIGPTAEALSYRATEDYHALSLENRISLYQQVASLKGQTVGGSTIPSLNAENIYNHTNQRGNSRRPDSYILTQFTISYILSNSIKCPPTR
jgi:hypothetical protein